MALNIVPTWIGELSATADVEFKKLHDAVQSIIASLNHSYNPPTPPPPIENDVLYYVNWENRFNLLLTSLEPYRVTDRTTTWGSMTISIASYTKVMDSEKLAKPLLDLVKADNLIDFGGIVPAIKLLNLQNLTLTNLDNLITLADGAVAYETAKIQSFATQSNYEIQKIATARLLKDPGTLSVINDTLGIGTAYKAFGIM